MAKRRVVVTGAAGYLGQRIWGTLSERYELVALDVRERTSAGERVPGIVLCDLTARDRDAYREHFQGADTVVHNAFVAPPGSNASLPQANEDENFWAEHDNVAMAYNVYRVALEEGVRRVVVSSSNHAADWYERLIWSGRWDHVTPEMAPYSDNFYGWAKIAYEALGFVFATGEVGGRKLEVIQLRIGGPRDHADLTELEPGEIARMHRGLGAYLSRRDQAQLYVRSIEAERIEDAFGIPFQIFYGVSANTHNFWSIANARRVIGYAPQDNSQVRFAARIAEIARAGANEEGSS